MTFSNLDNVVVVSTDGSYFGLNTAYLIDTEALTPEQLEDLYEGSDSDRADLCSDVGTDLSDVVGNDIAMDRIARLLSGAEWDADLVMQVAEIVKGTGRGVEDLS